MPRRVQIIAKQAVAYLVCFSLAVSTSYIPAAKAQLLGGSLGGGGTPIQNPLEDAFKQFSHPQPQQQQKEPTPPSPPAQAAPQSSTRKPSIQTSAKSQDEVANRLHNSISDIDNTISKINRSKENFPRFNSVDSIDKYIAKQFVIVPYSGVLKGFDGVLAEGTANSLEAALVGAKLAKDAGFTSRIGSKKLSPGEARQLLEQMKTRVTIFKNSRTSADYLTSFEPSLSAVVDFLSEDLLRAVAPHRETATKAQKTWEADYTSNLRTHWWLEVRDGDDWIVIDPLEFVDESKNAPVYSSPASARRKQSVDVNFSLMVEVEGGKAPGEYKIAEINQSAAAISGKTIHIKHMPLGVGELPSGVSVDASINQLSSARAWVPILALDAEKLSTKLFYIDGTLEDATDANLLAARGAEDAGLAGGTAAATKSVGSSLLDIVNQAVTPENAPQRSTKGRVVREWVSIQVATLDRGAKEYERNIFDIRNVSGVSGTDKRTLGLLGSTSFQFDTYVLSQRAFVSRAAKTLSLAKDAVDSPDGPFRMLERTLLDSVNFDRFQHFRWAWQSARSVYVDRVQIASIFQELERRGTSQIVIRDGFDIIENGVGVRPEKKLSDEPFEIQLHQGVADTVVEVYAPTSHALATNAAIAHHLTMKTKGRLEIRKSQTSANTSVVLVIPKYGNSKGGERTWWRIDPLRGTTLGVDGSGRGVSTEAYLGLALLALDVSFVIFNFLDCIHARQWSGAFGKFMRENVREPLDGWLPLGAPGVPVPPVVPVVSEICAQFESDGKDVAYRIPWVNPDGIPLDVGKPWERYALCTGESAGHLFLIIALEGLGAALARAMKRVDKLADLARNVDDVDDAFDTTFSDKYNNPLSEIEVRTPKDSIDDILRKSNLNSQQREALRELTGEQVSKEMKELWDEALYASPKARKKMSEARRLVAQGRQNEAYRLANDAYKLVKRRFWPRVRKRFGQRISDAGLKFSGGPESAPRLELTDGTYQVITLEHLVKQVDDPTLATDPFNLLFSLQQENTVYMEMLRRCMATDDL